MIEHILSHETNFSTFKKTEITQSVFSTHKGIKLEIKNRRKFGKFTNMWKLKTTLLKRLMSQRRNYKGNFKSTLRDFPGGTVDKTLCSQCRGPGFNPWSGN